MLCPQDPLCPLPAAVPPQLCPSSCAPPSCAPPGVPAAVFPNVEPTASQLARSADRCAANCALSVEAFPKLLGVICYGVLICCPFICLQPLLLTYDLQAYDVLPGSRMENPELYQNTSRVASN